MATKSKFLPIISLSKSVLFPHTIGELTISNKDTLKVIDTAMVDHNGKIIFVNPRLTEIKNKRKEQEIMPINSGVLAKVLRVDLQGSRAKVIVEVLNRVNINEEMTITEEGIALAETSTFKTKLGSTKGIQSARELINEVLKSPAKLPFVISKVEVTELDTLNDVKFIDRMASIVPLTDNDKLNYLMQAVLIERYLVIVDKLHQILEDSINPEDIVKGTVKDRVNTKVSKQQKEFYLREQIKAAQSELDELTGADDEITKYRKKVEENPYPEHIKEKLLSEIRKLEQTPAQAQEANITRGYIEWLLDLPYWQHDVEKINITDAKKQLDKEHFGLEKPKSKIIEFLAVKQQNPDAKGSILALVGPPGTGKTTMAKSIADALGRKLIKISLGGVKDEAEIRGHRRTYIASQPGKIIQGMKKAGVNNPIILLDEIDKMSADFKGDPTSAMLEVLDYEQNAHFQDHFIEEEYDLSNVTFIATANYFQNIPEALIDRLDIVEVSSYTELEKIQIFKDYLIERVLTETKIPKGLFKWSDASIRTLIRHYTIEAGVRQLHREANTLARKILVKKHNGKLKSTLSITPKIIEELLGPQKFDYTKIDKKPQVGAVTGLAWTQYGGDILPIEVTLYPGKGDIILTGQLKDVMKESASIAFSYIKANAKEFGIKDVEKLNDMNIHIHSPDGATPKDGPSAGVTFTTAIISALTKKKVSQYIGMTGEISLRGHVLPIGGLKEKSISAYRSGLKKIFIPKENTKDLIEIPKEVRENLEIQPVEKYSDIFKEIFK